MHCSKFAVSAMLGSMEWRVARVCCSAVAAASRWALARSATSWRCSAWQAFISFRSFAAALAASTSGRLLLPQGLPQGG
ncbi:hypothetical protein CHLRE_02g142667v5 [Chlamydomonas reinhardtii]|uniref:Uncharacterized protein n=1 Tax=Chlamydomonas reinhardtii TaxID=3055 RepID=A0A2K3E4F1_CHLRE|nr:uncharacterized protein CHLRE_02g142667v5 [Chlamydomonas reinhardtii]PNW87675.1 hypothetical protein CHLRE_02g142667v5 [Chlamydomonas reinhardtii]